ncbi:MAG: hypothetical protein KBT09_06425 [Bacteroidales bacterium]|nr:hypothetical protein [Candidatus Sodaliphilus fimicaballi]
MTYKCPKCGKALDLTSEELIDLQYKTECPQCNSKLEIVGDYAYIPLEDGSLDLTDEVQEEPVVEPQPKRDSLYQKAVDYIVTCNAITPTMLSEYFSIPMERAQALIDQLEQDGIVGPYNGGAPRKILIPHNTNLPFGLQDHFDPDAPTTPPEFKKTKVFTINCSGCFMFLLILLATIAILKML